MNSRRTKRGPEFRVPILTRIDPAYTVTPILNRKVRAQQADRDALLGRFIPVAGQIGVSDRELAADHGDQVTQIGAVADEGEQRLVLIVDPLPIVAVHLGVVEEFALDPPCLAIDLRPFGAGIDLHLEL